MRPLFFSIVFFSSAFSDSQFFHKSLKKETFAFLFTDCGVNFPSFLVLGFHSIFELSSLLLPFNVESGKFGANVRSVPFFVRFSLFGFEFKQDAFLNFLQWR